MKTIKFDLPIDGTKVKCIEELCDHLTIEILDHYRSGLLSKWLTSRKMHDELTAIEALDGFDEHALLIGLCEIFGVDIDDEIASAMLHEAPPKTEMNAKEQISFYDELAKDELEQEIMPRILMIKESLTQDEWEKTLKPYDLYRIYCDMNQRKKKKVRDWFKYLP